MTVSIEDAGHQQANAMTNGVDWFYPDSIEDARIFADEHDASPADCDAFGQLFGWVVGRCET